MVMKQDPTHPTGVSSDDEGGSNLARARERKVHSAIQMRRGGALWDEIAEVLGYPTGRTAQVQVEKALEKELDTPEGREFLKRLADERYNRLLRAVWTQSIDPDHPDQLAYFDRSVKVIERLNKLHGLDAPTEYVVSTPSQAELESWVAQMTAASTPEVEQADIFGGEVVAGEVVVPDAVPAD